MEINKISKEELETMGYDDIAYLVLKEKNKKMKIIDLFTEVCKLLELSSKDYEDKIGDFFEILTTNKKFILLDKGFWDLKENHTPKIIVDEDEEEEIISETVEETTEESADDIYYEENENDDSLDNELEDLVVIDSEDEENISL